MRLLIWSQHFWPENFGINQLAVCLVRKGHDVTVLTGKPNYPDGKFYPGYTLSGMQVEHWNGIRIVRIPMMPRGPATAWRLALNYLSFIASGYVLAPVALRRMKFEAIFVYATSPLPQALPAIWISWLKRVPLAVWVQDLWPESLRATGHVKNEFILSAVRHVVGYLYRRCDSILIQSEAFRGHILSICKEAENKIHYFPNSVEIADVDQTNDVLPEGLQRKMKAAFSVVFAGNIGKAQSIETILKAASQLADVADIHFFIVGTGSEAQFVSSKIDSMHLTNVSMTGLLPPSSMPCLFQSASVLLITLGKNDALDATVPSKVQAYFAAGKPVVASMNGEGARLVEIALAGLTCPAGDDMALAACVMRLYKMQPGERIRLGVNGRLYAKACFDVNERADELALHLQSL